MSHWVIVQEDLVLAGPFDGSRDFVGHLKVGIRQTEEREDIQVFCEGWGISLLSSRQQIDRLIFGRFLPALTSSATRTD